MAVLITSHRIFLGSGKTTLLNHALRGLMRARALVMVSQFHGETLLRVRGLLRVEEEHGPVAVQAVQHVASPTCSMPRRPSEDRSSRVMVITRGMLVALVEQLRSSLDRLLNATAARVGATARNPIEASS